MPKDNTDHKPNDLITAKQAGKRAGKSVSTIRSWVRKEKLSGYKKNPDNPSDPLMISQHELKVYLATNATPTHPNNTGRNETLSVSMKKKDQEIAKLKEQLMVMEDKFNLTSQRVIDLVTLSDTLKSIISSRDNDLKSLQDQNKGLLDLHAKMQDDNNNLMKYLSMPWWQRWKSNSVLLENK